MVDRFTPHRFHAQSWPFPPHFFSAPFESVPPFPPPTRLSPQRLVSPPSGSSLPPAAPPRTNLGHIDSDAGGAPTTLIAATMAEYFWNSNVTDCASYPDRSRAEFVYQCTIEASVRDQMMSLHLIVIFSSIVAVVG